MTLQLHRFLHPQVQADERLLHVYRDIEIPVMGVLFDMECTGVLLDARLLEVEERRDQVGDQNPERDLEQVGGFQHVLGAGEGWAKSILFNDRARAEFALDDHGVVAARAARDAAVGCARAGDACADCGGDGRSQA